MTTIAVNQGQTKQSYWYIIFFNINLKAPTDIKAFNMYAIFTNIKFQVFIQTGNIFHTAVWRRFAKTELNSYGQMIL